MRVRGRSSGRSGFTLIELMVVVSIIAFVTAAVVPTFGMSLLRNRQREAAELVVHAVFAARSRAARTGRCHRVRVYFRQAGYNGGEGGIVAVDEANAAECSRADAANEWTRLSYRSVWESADPITGDSHAGLVGQDVAIADQGGGFSGSDFILFEPSGGVYIRDALPHEYQILAYKSDGGTTGITGRVVRITSGGSVRYTLK